MNMDELPGYSVILDTPEYTQLALNILRNAAHANPNAQNDMQTQRLGKSAMSAILFMNKGSIKNTVCDIIVFLVDNSERVSFMKLNDIPHVWYFKVILISSLKHLQFEQSPSEKDQLQEYVSYLLTTALELIVVDKPCTSAILKTMSHLLAKYDGYLYQELKLKIFTRMTLLLNEGTDRIKTLARVVVKRVIKTLQHQLKIVLLNTIIQKKPWTKIEFFICSCLVHGLPEPIVSYLLGEFLQNIHLGLQYNQNTYGAQKLLQAIIAKVNDHAFNGAIVPTIATWCSSSCREIDLSTIKKMVLPVCVKQHRELFYYLLVNQNVDHKVSSYVLFLCINGGMCDINNFTYDINVYLKSSNQEVNNLAFMTICAGVKATENVNMWCLQLIATCMDEAKINLSDTELLKVLKMCLMHLCSNFCQSLERDASWEGAYALIQFFAYMHHKCYKNYHVFLEDQVVSATALLQMIAETHLRKPGCFQKQTDDYYDYKYPAYVDVMRIKYEIFARRLGKLLLEKIVEHEEYYPNVFEVLANELLAYIDVDQVDSVFDAFMLFACTPTFVANAKFIQVTNLLVKKRKLEKLSVDHVVLKLHELLQQQNQAIYLGIASRQYDNLMVSCFGALNVFYNNANVDMPEDETDFIFVTTKNTVKLLLKLVMPKKPLITGNLRKTIEQSLIGAIELMTSILVKVKYRESYMSVCLALSKRIITSNMKRPISKAAICLKKICRILSANQKSYSTFVDEHLDVACRSESRNETVRRNPEARFIVHAIALSDINTSRIYVYRTLRYLLSFVNDNEHAEPALIASALNCLELLVSDHSISYATASHDSEIMKLCMEKFGRPEWIIKNASLQVFQSLLFKLLGQAPEESDRPITADEFFFCNPDLGLYTFKKLACIKTSPHDTTIAILMLLTQTVSSSNVFQDSQDKDIINGYLRLLVHLIKTHEDILGFYASKAFAALCPLQEIPYIINESVDYIIKEFGALTKNVFRHIVLMVRDLYDRYRRNLSKFENVLQLSKMHESFQNLTVFLSHTSFRSEFDLYSLLGVNVGTVEEITADLYSLLELGINDGLTRVKLQNNLGFILEASEKEEFVKILSTCFSYDLSEHLQMLCLNHVLKRLDDNPTVYHDSFEFLINLLLRMLNSEKTTLPILFSRYCLAIITVVEYSPDEYLLSDNLRRAIHDSYVHNDKIIYCAVYISLISKASGLTCRDKEIIRSVLNVYYASSTTQDADEQEILGTTLKYLHNCVDFDDRFIVLQVAFILLSEDSCGKNICKFLSEVMNAPHATLHSTIRTCLKIDYLNGYFCNADQAETLLFDIMARVSPALCAAEDQQTFYGSSEGKKTDRNVFMFNVILENLISNGYTYEKIKAEVMKRL